MSVLRENRRNELLHKLWSENDRKTKKPGKAGPICRIVLVVMLAAIIYFDVRCLKGRTRTATTEKRIMSAL